MGRGRKTGKEESPVVAETNELVRNLKEIVDNDFTDTEIFAVLQECQMNPDEAAQGLLSLDKFHEVKSKRERRKEVKEAQESKVRVGNISGVDNGWESNIGLAPSHDSHNVLAEVSKGANMRGNSVDAPSVTSSSFSSATTSIKKQPTGDSGTQIVGAGAMISSNEELDGGFQPAFIGGPHHSGYSSLAEVVRLGRPRGTVSHMVDEISYTKNDKDSVSLVGEFCQNSLLEEVQVSKHDVTSSNQSSNFAESDCSFTGERCTDKVEDEFHCGSGSMEDMTFHNSHGHVNEHQVVSRSLNNGRSATSLSLEKLNLGQEEKEVSSLSNGACTVVLPKCVQALDADCLKLCFGTYNACGNTDIAQNLRFNLVKSKMEEASANIQGNSGFFADPLHGELYGSNPNTVRLTTENNNHEFPVSSQIDLSKKNIHESWEHESKLELDSIFYSSPWSAAVHPLSREFYPSHRDPRTSVTQTPLAVDESAFCGQSAKDPNSVYSFGRTQSNTNQYLDTVSRSGSLIIPTEISDSGYSADPQIYPEASLLQRSHQDSTYCHESLVDVKPNPQKLGSIASGFNLPPYEKISAQAMLHKSLLKNLSSNAPNQSAIGYNDVLGAQYNVTNYQAMLQQNDNINSWDYGLGSGTPTTAPDGTYYNRLAQSQPFSTHQYRDNSNYNLNGLDGQLSAYHQGVPDNSYLNVQRQTQLLGIPDDRYNSQVFDRLIRQNLQAQSQKLSQNYANIHSRDAFSALHYPQGSSAAFPQRLDNVHPAPVQGFSKQLQMNRQNFY